MDCITYVCMYLKLRVFEWQGDSSLMNCEGYRRKQPWRNVGTFPAFS